METWGRSSSWVHGQVSRRFACGVVESKEISIEKVRALISLYDTQINF